MYLAQDSNGAKGSTVKSWSHSNPKLVAAKTPPRGGIVGFPCSFCDTHTITANNIHHLVFWVPPLAIYFENLAIPVLGLMAALVPLIETSIDLTSPLLKDI